MSHLIKIYIICKIQLISSLVQCTYRVNEKNSQNSVVQNAFHPCLVLVAPRYILNIDILSKLARRL